MKTQKTWFITGASRGFGLDITKAVLASGDRVIATVRSEPEKFAAQFPDKKDLYTVTLDVTNDKPAKEAARLGIAHFGKVPLGTDTYQKFYEKENLTKARWKNGRTWVSTDHKDVALA